MPVSYTHLDVYKRQPLNYVAEVVSARGPNTINRENVKRKIVISANVADRDLRSVVNDIQKFPFLTPFLIPNYNAHSLVKYAQ